MDLCESLPLISLVRIYSGDSILLKFVQIITDTVFIRSCNHESSYSLSKPNSICPVLASLNLMVRTFKKLAGNANQLSNAFKRFLRGK